MKTIKLFTTVTAAAIVAIATAVERPKMNVIPVSADKAIIEITNENPALFEVSVETLKGDVVYYRQSSKPITDYKKTFDFSNLEDGNYLLNLRVNDTELSKEFTYSRNGIEVGDSKLKFDPYFIFKNDELRFSYLNTDLENFNVNVYSNGELIFQKKLGNNFSIQNGLNLSKLDKGEYKVVLSSLNNEYVYSLVK